MLVYLLISPSMSRSSPAELCHHGVLFGGGATAVESWVNVLPITPFSVGFSVQHHQLHDSWFAGPAPVLQMNFSKWHFHNQSCLILKTFKTEISSTMTPTKPAGSSKSPDCKELSGNSSRFFLLAFPSLSSWPLSCQWLTSSPYCLALNHCESDEFELSAFKFVAWQSVPSLFKEKGTRCNLYSDYLCQGYFSKKKIRICDSPARAHEAPPTDCRFL